LPTAPGPVMSLREAADALGVHYQTAYGWIRSGELSARKVGRGYAVSRAAR
jgi:MerR family transcriptional regulator, light-induced transcriptional regulator